MMFILLLAILLGVAAAVVTWRALNRYISSLRIRNGLLALAVKELKEASESMLETPHDIPDRVLELLGFMNDSAFKKDIPRIFSEVASENPMDADKSRKTHISQDLELMRPELQALFFKAVASWLNIICNRNIRYGLMISMAFNNIKVSRREVMIDEQREALEVLRKITRKESSLGKHTALPAC